MSVTHTYAASPVEGGTLSLHGGNVGWCKLEDDKLFVVYKQDTIHRTMGVIVTLNGNSAPTYSTPWIINSTMTNTYPAFECSRVKTADDVNGTYKVAIKYITSNDNQQPHLSKYNHYIFIVDVAADNSMTAGTATFIHNTHPTCPMVTNNVQDRLYLSYIDASGDTWIQARTVSGTSLSSVAWSTEIHTSAAYGGVVMRTLENGYIMGLLWRNASEVQEEFVINSTGTLSSNLGTTYNHVGMASYEDETEAFVAYNNNIYRLRISDGARLSTIGVVTTDTSLDTVIPESNTIISLSSPTIAASFTTAQALDISVYKYTSDSQSVVTAEINPVSLPASIIGHTTRRSHNYWGFRNQNILHKIDVNNIAVIGVYNDSGNKFGMQIITAV